MARIVVNGIGLDYELVGDAGAPAVVITPGGRFAKETPGVPELARLIAASGKRVLLWDRPSCGAYAASRIACGDLVEQGRRHLASAAGERMDALADSAFNSDRASVARSGVEQCPTNSY